MLLNILRQDDSKVLHVVNLYVITAIFTQLCSNILAFFY